MRVTDMSYESMLSLWFPILLFGVGSSETKELYGALGNLVTFRLREPPPYQKIYWSKSVGNNSTNITVANSQEPCRLQDSHAAYEERLRVSENCQELHLSHLEKGDAGRYTADIVRQKTTFKESFDLQVFRRLQECEVKVTCVSDGSGSGAWWLNCSQETWEDGVEFKLGVPVMNTDATLGSSVMNVISQDFNLPAICKANNKASEVYRMVNLKEVCAGENGILGESATFKVKTCPPYKRISWKKTEEGPTRVTSFSIAEVNFTGTLCHLHVTHSHFKESLNVSEDCTELHLSHLERKDAGRYTATILLQNEKIVNVSFDLQVFKRLQESQLRVTCVPADSENTAWQLHCSKETWEDGTTFRWSSAVHSTQPTPGSSTIKFISRNVDLTVTCIAKNPSGEATKTVSLMQVCAGHTISRLSLWALLCLSKVGSLLLLGCLGLLLVVKSRKAAGGRRMLVRFRPASQRRPPQPPARASSHDRSSSM